MKLHLIGICGTGMGSLAGLLKAAGHDVRGSDEHVYPPMSTQLAAQAIPVFDGFAPANLDWAPDRVVVGNVCRRDHVEAVEAERRGIPLTSFPAALAEHFLASRVPLVVAGTHGKTTTSSIAAAVLLGAGRDAGFLIGGVPLGFAQPFRAGAPGAPFVVEGDEYDTAFFDKGSKFFHYRPQVAILTSVELDHVDIFDSLDAVKAAFKKFVALIPPEGLLVVCADDPGALECAAAARCRVERYHVEGAGKNGSSRFEWVARPVGTPAGGGRTRFRVERAASPGAEPQLFGEFEIGLPGAHNLANALSVVAACASGFGLREGEIAPGLAGFVGVKRRQEVRGVAQGVTVLDDFAHHPTAVRATIASVRGRFGQGRLIAVYEPRSATSRRAVFQSDFVEAFAKADEVVVAAVDHPEKAPEGDRFDAERLAADLRRRGVPARHIVDVDAIAEHVAARAAAGDTVLVMSSGGFGGVHDRILDRLGTALTDARPEDASIARALLDRVGLPYPDLEAHLGELIVMRDEGQVIGCVATEMYGDSGLLRSLAVVPERRGEGLGWMLADAAVNRGRQRGARRMYLVSTMGTDFFAEKFGFKECDPEALTPGVRASSQFQADDDPGVLMKLDL